MSDNIAPVPAVDLLATSVVKMEVFGLGWESLVNHAAQVVADDPRRTLDLKKTVTHFNRTGHGLGTITSQSRLYLAQHHNITL